MRGVGAIVASSDPSCALLSASPSVTPRDPRCSTDGLFCDTQWWVFGGRIVTFGCYRRVYSCSGRYFYQCWNGAAGPLQPVAAGCVVATCIGDGEALQTPLALLASEHAATLQSLILMRRRRQRAHCWCTRTTCTACPANQSTAVQRVLQHYTVTRQIQVPVGSPLDAHRSCTRAQQEFRLRRVGMHLEIELSPKSAYSPNGRCSMSL